RLQGRLGAHGRRRDRRIAASRGADGGARHRVAGRRRLRGLPSDSQPLLRADPDADRARRRDRPRRRARGGRGRLRRQALLAARARRADQGDPAPHRGRDAAGAARARRRRAELERARGPGRGPSDRAPRQGVRPARVPDAAPRRRRLARHPARPRLGPRVRGRIAHGRRPRRPAPLEARPPRDDPHDSRLRLQSRRDLMRSLRAQLYLAIALAVTVSVALSLLAGAYLVRRSVKHQDLTALGRQADLIAAREQTSPVPIQQLQSLGFFTATQQQQLSILERPNAAALLPDSAGRELLAGRGSQGELTLHGDRFLFAARPAGKEEAVILLRRAKLEADDWAPFGLSFLVAGALGAA